MRSKDRTEREIKKLTVPVNIGSDHIRGSVNAPLNIVEYGDYECPYTGMAYPIVKEIVRQFGDKMYFVFRNFPLNDIHPHAQNAAAAVVSVQVYLSDWLDDAIKLVTEKGAAANAEPKTDPPVVIEKEQEQEDNTTEQQQNQIIALQLTKFLKNDDVIFEIVLIKHYYSPVMV